MCPSGGRTLLKENVAAKGLRKFMSFCESEHHSLLLRNCASVRQVNAKACGGIAIGRRYPSYRSNLSDCRTLPLSLDKYFDAVSTV